MNGLVIDLFAGGGGASAGIEAAIGRPVDIAINHDPVALAAHKANHPGTVEGHEYQIIDIGMRMLQPHELLRAQFGRFAAFTDLSVARTKAAMVRLIGNSVCPEVAEAIVAANAVKPVQAVAA